MSSNVPRYTAAELKELPTLAQGQADDLKKEETIGSVRYRWWLCRCDVYDGMPYDNAVTIEQYGPCTRYRWEELDRYPG